VNTTLAQLFALLKAARWLMYEYCTLGWVDFGLFTFSTKVPMRFVIYLPKLPKIAKKIFLTQWPLHYRSLLFGWCTRRVQNFFIHNMGFMVSEDAEFYLDFKNINLH
jgi:hypothetical protein